MQRCIIEMRSLPLMALWNILQLHFTQSMLHRNHTFLYRCIYTIHAAWFWQQVVGRISSCSTRYFYLYMYMYIDSDMHVKILHRQVHDYMYIDTCDISMYIYTHIPLSWWVHMMPYNQSMSTQVSCRPCRCEEAPRHGGKMCDPIDKSEVHRESWNGIEWKVSMYWKIGNWSPELMY